VRDPVLSRIFSQRRSLDTLFVVVIVGMEEKSETDLRKNRVRACGKDVIQGKIPPCGRQMIGRQELFDGQVRELHDPGASVVNDGDQVRTYGQNGSFLVVWPAIWTILRNASLSGIKVKCKDFGQLLDTERPDGNCEAVEEKASVSSVVLVDILQQPSVGFI
jgi:hypothetical protein